MGTRGQRAGQRRGWRRGALASGLAALLVAGAVGAESPPAADADAAAAAEGDVPAFTGRPKPKGGMPTGVAGAPDQPVGSPTAEQIRASLEDQLVAGAVRPRIDLHIAFAHDSAVLSDAGRRDLDEVGVVSSPLSSSSSSS